MAFEFDRYINGTLMAEGVIIERQKNLADAMREAARIASRGPNGEAPVLVLRAEAAERALAERAGVVKVKALEWEGRSGTFYADTALGEVCIDVDGDGFYVIENGRKHSEFASIKSAQAFVQMNHDKWVEDWLEPYALTTEPAAPEGRQDNEPRAYIVHAPEDDYYGTGPDRLQFHPLAQHDLDNGYRQTPLYGRPAEQAVTEAEHE